MKKTVYFKNLATWNTTIKICDEIIIQRDKFLEKHKNEIAKIDSEDLKVHHTGNNHCTCILRLTYYPKK